MGGSASVAPDENEGKGADARLKTDRGCTDILCLLLYLSHWGVFFFVTFLGVSNGNPSKLYAPRDFRGEYCGAETNWNNGLNLKDFPKLSYTMNVTHSAEHIALQLVCSTAAENALTSIMTATQLSDYRCACCKRACSTCFGSLNLVDFLTASAVASGTSSAAAKIGDLTTTANSASLFSADGPNGNYYSNMWEHATVFFNSVCLKLCNTPINTDLTTTYRSYTYSPPPTAAWKKAWDLLKTNTAVPTDIRNTINNQFTFKALPLDQCAYDPRYCVPFPGVDFNDESYDYCSFKASSSVVGAVGQAAADTFAELGNSDYSEAVSESFGTAMGDIMATMDALIVVGLCSLVIGLVFLVVMRFIVGIVVWCSLFFVLLAFLAFGAFFWIRSAQCKGAGLFDTGKQIGQSVTLAATSSVSGNTGNEDMTGNGADYRGVQTVTKSGYVCQRWDTQSPQQHTITPGAYPTSALDQNYCRNPTGAPTIWCFTESNVRWETCTPIGVVRPECADGYVVENETGRKVMEVVGVIFFVCAGLWILLVCCLCRRIRLAIAINKAAAMFVYNTPTVIFVPIVQVLTALIWCMLWVICAVFLVSQVPDGYTPTDYYSTWNEAAGTADTAGKCTDTAIPGFAWVDEGLPLSANNPCSGNMGDTTGITPRCYRCAPPRFIFDVRFFFQLFSLLWTNAFLIALGQCIIAGAVCIWFFADKGQKTHQNAVRRSTMMILWYHTGSLAFGAFIIAVIQLLRYIALYLEKQAQAQKNKIMMCVMKCAQYLLWCLEKCMKFMTKNAYIQVAIKGTNFCKSAKAAFFLIARNFIRFGIVATLGAMIHFLGFVFIMAATVLLGYFILQGLHPDVHPVLPMCVYVIVSYVVAKLYMNVLGLAIDTMLQCFIATEEMGEGDKEFVPGPLKSFIDSAPKVEEE
jgi:hypothetical protein